MRKINFTDKNGTFTITNPENYSGLYLPLAGEEGLKSSITPTLGGDSKTDQNHFLLEPVSIENLHNNRGTRNFWCRVEGKGYWSACGVSAEQEFDKYTDRQDESTLEAGMMWQKLTRTSKKYDLQSEITSFVSIDGTTEIQLIKITNLSEEEQEVTKAQEALNEAVNDSSIKGIYEAGNADGTYTSASWTAFREAYEAAKNVSEGASAEELKTLLTNLQNAKAGLKKSQTETPPTPNQTETPATPGQTEKPSTPEKPTVVQKVSKNVTYRVLDTKKKTAAVVGVGGKKGKKVTSLTIAKTVKINGVTYKVTKIGKNAFKGCKYLKKITIGSNVKKIEKGAFANCRKLASINMKKANGITSIGSKAFSRINSKAKVSVPSKKLSKYTRMLKKAGLPKKAVIKK